MKRLGLISFLVVLASQSLAGSQPMIGITANAKAPGVLAFNQGASATYTIKNNTRSTRTMVMQSIAGVTQITTTSGACPNPIVLNAGQSCLLELSFDGTKIPAAINGGPVVCYVKGSSNTPDPSRCFQPSQSDAISMKSTPNTDLSQNGWISVLLAQGAPPANLQTYVNQIYALAPAAEQIHPRVPPVKEPTVGASSTPAYQITYQNYADLIAKLRAAYATVPNFQVGFHVDVSKGSESDWGCATDDWECVLNYSLIVLNNINELADPNKTGQGFNIYSIEQGYIIPVDTTSLENVKACLNPPAAAAGATCPVATIASPTVTYGDVLGSYGGSDIYGPTKLDYGYPQYYNLVRNLSEAHGDVLITAQADSYFPPATASDCLGSSPSYPYNVIDANLTGGPIPAEAPRPPLIPCFDPNTPTDPFPNPANDVFTYQSTADPSLAAAYDAYLMTQLPPISSTVDTNGATVYITFSGEPEFLGGTGWTLAQINAFNQQLNTKFTTLNTLIPGIIPAGVDTSTIKYAIWNFEQILVNNN